MRFTDSVGTETVWFMHTLGVLRCALYAIWEAAIGATATGRSESLSRAMEQVRVCSVLSPPFISSRRVILGNVTARASRS